ncbi:MAG: hypothetical protein KC619_19785 [Myxococcales bacterium]|nr:hypothetical protein [Myxococcales bacterium]
MDCPNCGEWQLEGTRECGYMFIGYEAIEEAEEAEIRIRHKGRRNLGLGMIAAGVVLSIASFALSWELGAPSFLVFGGLVVGGAGVLLKSR